METTIFAFFQIVTLIFCSDIWFARFVKTTELTKKKPT